MRTVRLSLVGTFILVLLGGVGGAVAAQEPEMTTPVVVTGTEVCSVVQEGTLVDTRIRDHIMECTAQANDARVSGTGRTTYSSDCYPLPDGGRACVPWGTYVMEGEEGGWDCSWAGTSDLWGPNVGQVLSVCSGTRGYADLTYVYHHVFGDAQDFGDGTDIHGIIYEGPPPPWGPIPTPAE